MTRTENTAPATTTVVPARDLQEGDTITTRGARYIITGEPTYVRRNGQQYVRVTLVAVPAGLKTGTITGAYDLLAGDRINRH